LIWVLYVSGLLAVREMDSVIARDRFAEALELARGARDHMMAALALAATGRAALEQRDAEGARARFCEGLRLSRDAGFAIGLAYNLEGVALLCGARKEFERGARLLGAAEAAYAFVDVPGLVPYRSLVDRAVNSLRDSLGQDAFAAAYAAGRGLRTEEAVADALGTALGAYDAGYHEPGVTRRSRTTLPLPANHGLTAREVEVLHLLAKGRTNPEISAALLISVKTVERHLANVYAKIGARGRVDAATYAVNHGLS
jgi:DNA-binding CsgD family transcriptional regulator